MKRIALIGAAALTVAIGVLMTANFNAAPEARTAKTTRVLHLDHAAMSSAAQLSSFADVVVKGRFTGQVDRGLASEYRMASAGAGDVPVKLWNFRVEHTFKGQPGSDVLIAAYDTDAVTSEDVPIISAGSTAVVFLTEQVNGARVIVGGNQGMLALASDGQLKSVAPGVTFPDARDEAALTKTIQ